MRIYEYDEKAIEDAIIFLTDKFTKTGNNPKPVILHSIRVASLLWLNGASQNSVIAAILHDILEDTSVTPSEVEDKFGKNISDIVQSLTFDTNASDYESKLSAAERSFCQSKSIGLEALHVRASDLIDNSHYYKLSNDKELVTYLKKKYELFISISRSHLVGTVIGDLLEKTYRDNVKNL